MLMKIRLLPSNCIDPLRLQPLTTFVVNDTLAIDAGCLGYALNLEEQRRVRRAIITHTHSDHTASLPIFLAEVFPFLKEPFVVHGLPEVIEGLEKHIFNDLIWPDFINIKLLNGNGAGLRYVAIEPGVPFAAENLLITPVRTNHTVPSVGVSVDDGASSVLFTSDTYYTDEVWALANRLKNLKAVFVDVSYPNEMEELAAASKHYTPRALDSELKKLRHDVPVYAVHLKPQFRAEVSRQVAALDRNHVSVAEINHIYAW